MSISPVSVGQLAPDFTLQAVFPGGTWQPVTLSSFAAAGRWTAAVFYPLDFSPACTAQVPDYSRCAADFDAAGAEVLCISRDSVYTHRAWSRTLDLHIPLLSDMTLSVAAQYGAALLDSGYAARATFLIDPGRRVRWLHRESDPGEVTLGARDVLNALARLSAR